MYNEGTDERSRDTRLSPGSLQQRLRTELNLLDVYQESTYQIQALENANVLNRAQQETAILAQAWQQQQLMDERDKRLQREIDLLRKKLENEKKREMHVQTEQTNLNESTLSR